MNDFTASNGVYVVSTNSGMTAYSPGESWPNPEFGRTVHFNADVFTALREFFRADEDERLGRWRWPEDRDVYVRSIENDPDHVEVHDEASGEITTFTRGRMSTEGAGDWYLTRAARAYFDAHPEPTPWHDAKPGEMWLLTIRGKEVPAIRGDVVDFITTKPGDTALPFNSDKITAGRRIYPEVTS